MAIHDWTKVDAGLFHHFHQGWIVALCDALNMGLLPDDYFVMIEKCICPLEASASVNNSEPAIYAGKACTIAVRRGFETIVAMVEIVSPGNKGSRSEFRAFVTKASDLIQRGVHLLVIDLFPPGKRDPQGIHKAIWDEIEEEDLQLPPGKSRTLASYDAGDERVAYVNFIAVGDDLPEMPIFLRPDIYVPAPLEATYQTAWRHFPRALKGLLEPKE